MSHADARYMVAPRIVGELLRFQQDGAYRTWRDDRELEPGAEMLALMPSLTIGWLCWRDRKIVGQIMGRVADNFRLPLRQQLPNPTEAWIRTDHLVLVDTAGGEIFTLTTSSDGGRKAIGQLCTTYGQHLRFDPSSLPVVALNTRTYHAHAKTIWAPVLTVVTWR